MGKIRGKYLKGMVIKSTLALKTISVAFREENVATHQVINLQIIGNVLASFDVP